MLEEQLRLLKRQLGLKKANLMDEDLLPETRAKAEGDIAHWARRGPRRGGELWRRTTTSPPTSSPRWPTR